MIPKAKLAGALCFSQVQLCQIGLWQTGQMEEHPYLARHVESWVWSTFDPEYKSVGITFQVFKPGYLFKLGR